MDMAVATSRMAFVALVPVNGGWRGSVSSRGCHSFCHCAGPPAEMAIVSRVSGVVAATACGGAWVRSRSGRSGLAGCPPGSLSTTRARLADSGAIRECDGSAWSAVGRGLPGLGGLVIAVSGAVAAVGVLVRGSVGGRVRADPAPSFEDGWRWGSSRGRRRWWPRWLGRGRRLHVGSFGTPGSIVCVGETSSGMGGGTTLTNRSMSLPPREPGAAGKVDALAASRYEQREAWAARSWR